MRDKATSGMHVRKAQLVHAGVALANFALVAGFVQGNVVDLQPPHVTIVLLTCCSILSVIKPAWSSKIWMVFFCLDGLGVLIVYTLVMTPEASAAWTGKLVQGRVPAVCAALGLGVLNEMMTQQGIMPRRVQLVGLFCVIAYYGFAMPAATFTLHGPALGAEHLKLNLGCFAIPVVLGKIIARLVAMHTRVATPPVVVEKIVVVPQIVPVPGPPVMVEPVMVPVAGVPMMPPNEGHDLNDSEGDLSASPSRSSSGDSEFLAAWGPMAFGELQDADEHDEHDEV